MERGAGDNGNLGEVQRGVWICRLADHDTCSLPGPIPAPTQAFITFLAEKQDEDLSGGLLGKVFLSVWVEKQGPPFPGHQALQNGHPAAWTRN